MERNVQSAFGLVLVVASMMPLFVLPKQDFALSTVFATSCMAVVALKSGNYRSLFSPKVWTVALGLVAAAALYTLFFIGNGAITTIHPFGIGPSAESSIYNLIASAGSPIPLQVVVLGFDTVGFESYFRGTLQTRWGTRLGRGAPFAVAAVDALIHVASLNPLWVATTFVADSVWGLTFSSTGDLTSSMASHFVWDIAIFIISPIG